MIDAPERTVRVATRPLPWLCPRCRGQGWVCEDHPHRAWGDGDSCCGGAGMPCRCNTDSPPWKHA